MAVERYITCQRPGCERIKRVRSPYEQRTQRFCSRRCQGKVTGGLLKFTTAQRQAWAAQARDVRRKRAVARLHAMTKTEIMRHAYTLGYKAGARATLRKMQGRAA